MDTKETGNNPSESVKDLTCAVLASEAPSAASQYHVLDRVLEAQPNLKPEMQKEGKERATVLLVLKLPLCPSPCTDD